MPTWGLPPHLDAKASSSAIEGALGLQLSRVDEAATTLQAKSTGTPLWSSSADTYRLRSPPAAAAAPQPSRDTAAISIGVRRRGTRPGSERRKASRRRSLAGPATAPPSCLGWELLWVNRADLDLALNFISPNTFTFGEVREQGSGGLRYFGNVRKCVAIPNHRLKTENV